MVTSKREIHHDIDSIDVRTARVEAVRQRYYQSQVHLCAGRCHLATESWKETEGQPVHRRRAKLFAKICDEIPIAIFEHELIVGSQTPFVRGTEIGLDYHPKGGLELAAGERRIRAEQTLGVISDEDLRTITEDSHYWQGRSPGEQAVGAIREIMGLTFKEITNGVGLQSFGMTGNLPRHVDYGKVLRQGLRGVIAEIEKEMAGLQFTSRDDARKYQFLQAAKICCEAEIRYAKRYAALAWQLAAKEIDEQRKAELETIAKVCEHVPENPARDFREALQSVRFIHLGLYLEVGYHNIILGRMDQYLYPFYQSDVDEGKMTRQQAAELLGCFWVKMAEMEGFKLATHRVGTEGSTYHKTTLGGVDEDGKDASNELTYLILHVIGQMKVLLPVYFRWHSGTPRELMSKAVWTNKQTGSEPGFHNDEQIIPGLLADGASLQDARDYFIAGCAHPFPRGWLSVPGHTTAVNGGKVLELVMYNGYDPQTKTQLGIRTGDPRQFASIQDWVDAYMKQWEYVYGILLKGLNIAQLTLLEVYGMPFTSALAADRIEKVLDTGPGVGYPQFAVLFFNRIYADVPDSLMAIKKLVYEQHRFTVDELIEACANNFEGEKGEYIREITKAAPKYGNDSGAPEEMYRLLSDRTATVIRSGKNLFGYPIRELRNGAALHFSHGLRTGALPNGRKAGMPLADGGISPCASCDTKGPTATFRSAAKAVDFKIVRSAILNQKMPKALLKAEGHINRFIDLVETYFIDYNGYQVQWNIQDKAVYLAAKTTPSAYKDLIVRVGGYSAYFIELAPALQDEIIARTEQWV